MAICWRKLVYGNIDLFEPNDIVINQSKATYIDFSANPGISGFTLPQISNRNISYFGAGSCSLSGTIDLSMFHLSGISNEIINGIYLSNNPGVNCVLLKNEIHNNYISLIEIDGCSIGTPYVAPSAGTINWNTTIDLTSFPNINGYVNITNNLSGNSNSAITYVYFPTLLTGGSISINMGGLPFYTGNSYNVDLTFANGHLGQYLWFPNLPQITGFTYYHPEPNPLYQLSLNDCNIQGALDFTNMYGLQGYLDVSNNTGLTSMTFSTHQINGFSQFHCRNTGLYNIDLSMFNDIGNYGFDTINNSNLTGITFPNDIGTSAAVYLCYLQNNNLYDLDFTNTHLAHPYGTRLVFNNNPNLSAITFPKEYVNTNTGNSYNFIYGQDCNLQYFGIENLSGINHNSLQIQLQDNNMTSSIVNQCLHKLDVLGWTGNSINIAGNNNAPDSSSGGYNGIAAKMSLSAKSWSVITS